MAIKDSAKAAALDVAVIVVINRCTDRTEEIALQQGCTVVHSEAKNLSIIRNIGVRATKTDYIATIDADSLMSRGMLTRIIKHLNQDKIVGGGVLIIPERWSLGILISALALLPLVLYYKVSCGLFFFRRQDFEAINGFDESLTSLEDIDFGDRLRRYGKLTGRRYATIFRDYIVTSCRKFDRFGDWYFLLHPLETWRIIKGRDQKAADKVWYDFEH